MKTRIILIGCAVFVLSYIKAYGEVILLEKTHHPSASQVNGLTVVSSASSSEAEAAMKSINDAYLAHSKYREVGRCRGMNTGWWAYTQGDIFGRAVTNRINNAMACGMKTPEEALRAVLKRCAEKSRQDCRTFSQFRIRLGKDALPAEGGSGRIYCAWSNGKTDVISDASDKNGGALCKL